MAVSGCGWVVGVCRCGVCVAALISVRCLSPLLHLSPPLFPSPPLLPSSLPSLQMLPQPKVPPNLSKITIIPQDSLKLEDKLGSGAFGIVYKGYWMPEGEEFEYTVAVKVLNENTGAEATSELLDVSGTLGMGGGGGGGGGGG